MEAILALWPLLPGEQGHSPWPNGIPRDLLDFIHQVCRCLYCGSSLPAPLSPCSCQPDHERWPHFEDATVVAVYPHHEHQAFFARLLRRRKGREANRRRLQAERKAGGKRLTRVDKNLLFGAQQGLCFYCGAELIEHGPGRYHHDHHVAVACGGRPDIDNAVLACPRCNSLKGHVYSGKAFVARALELGLVSDQPRMQAMRHLFIKWRREQGLRSLQLPSSAYR